MEVRRIALIGVLLFACTISAQQVSSGNNATSGSGSGSGSGYRMARDCVSLGCSHNCTESGMMGPTCFCPAGYHLGPDEINCQPCPGGYWGMECAMRCDCGQGNGCDRENGMCVCNSCWQYDATSMNCSTSMGYDCFLEFLAIADKNVVELRNMYGGDAYPMPREEDIDNLVAAGLLSVQSQVIQNIKLEEISRDNVMQGPLVKLTWRVDYNFDRPQATRGLNDLEEKVKLGDIRATLVIQDKQDYADVTLNAGTKQEP